MDDSAILEFNCHRLGVELHKKTIASSKWTAEKYDGCPLVAESISNMKRWVSEKAEHGRVAWIGVA